MRRFEQKALLLNKNTRKIVCDSLSPLKRRALLRRERRSHRPSMCTHTFLRGDVKKSLFSLSLFAFEQKALSNKNTRKIVCDSLSPLKRRALLRRERRSHRPSICTHTFLRGGVKKSLFSLSLFVFEQKALLNKNTRKIVLCDSLSPLKRAASRTTLRPSMCTARLRFFCRERMTLFVARRRRDDVNDDALKGDHQTNAEEKNRRMSRFRSLFFFVLFEKRSRESSRIGKKKPAHLVHTCWQKRSRRPSLRKSPLEDVP